MDQDCQRQTELSTLEAIFPEIKKPDIGDPFSFTLQVPVRPLNPVTVGFPVSSVAVSASTGQQPREDGALDVTETYELHHLPPLSMTITLPATYPEHDPPAVTLGTTPDWLPDRVLRHLEHDLVRIWEESGRDLVCFAYIDHLQQQAEEIFDIPDLAGVLRLEPRHRIQLLDHDILEKKAEFERNTFECGICLDPKKGSACHEMLDCGHVFCLGCLRDFYNKAIERGELNTVRCLAPGCAKERAARQSPRKGRRFRMQISPGELLQIGLSEAIAKRYVSLSYKTELEADKNTIYCPRSWCSGAARSRKHRKPTGFEISEPDSGCEDDEEDYATGANAAASAKSPKTAADLLAICEDCSFAFCSQCLQSWHGEFTDCHPPKTAAEISAEERASIEYMQFHTSPCPTCSAPAQKTYGCNHMTCSRCNTHFCYLCGAWLDQSNPYSHYNIQEGGKVTACFGRLWELKDGDGDDVNHAGRRRGAAAEAGRMEEGQQQDDERGEEGLVLMLDHPEPAPPVQQPQGGGGDGQPEGNEVGHAMLAREGPLILRLVANVPQAAAPVVGEAAGDGPAGQRGGRGGRPNRVQARGGRRGQAINNRRGGPGQQQQQQQQQQQGNVRGDQGAARAAPRGGRGGGRGRGNAHGNAANAAGQDQVAVLNQQQQDWVRRFVELALLDMEDLMDFDFDILNEGLDDADFAIEEVP